MSCSRGRFGDRDEAYGRLFDAICAAREREFCIRPSDLEVTPTSGDDVARRDHPIVVHMEYCDVRTRMGRIDLWRPLQAKADFKRLMYDNEPVLRGGVGEAERQVHVRHVAGELEVGVSEFGTVRMDGVATDILSGMARDRWADGHDRVVPDPVSSGVRDVSRLDVEFGI